jgi:hypothetical protein
LMEAGFAAVGMSGFFGAMQKGGEALVSELGDVIAKLRPTRILFCGDADTALNYQFAVAVVRFAKLVAPIPVALPRIALNGPGNGADDCKERFGASFPEWWRDRVSQSIRVESEGNPALLAVELFECERGAFEGLSKSARYDAERRMVKLAASLKAEPILQNRITQFAVRKLGYRRDGINRVLKSAEAQLKRARQNEREAKGAEIEHHMPAAVWTRQVWESVGQELYRYAEQVCRYHEGRLPRRQRS